MNKILSRLLLGGSVAAIAATSLSISYAQTAGPAADSDNLETVTVSASRISIAGYTAPTPVTVVNSATLEAEAKTDIGDAIRELPAVQGASPQQGSNAVTVTGATEGPSNIFLRNLGLLRTLVLVDGQRVVSANTTGGVDISIIPTALVQRVDVVTGGASAAWGSDAVAGVINLILNKNFTGFKAEIEGSDNNTDTYTSAQATASWGSDFAGGRGHIILSGSYQNSPNIVFSGYAPWYNKTQLVPNTAYNATTNPNVPQLVRASNIGQSNATIGGLIVSNPKGTGATPAAANVLRGIDFLGPNAQPTPINIGNIAGAASYGGDLGFLDSQSVMMPFALPHRDTTFFAFGAYKLTDTIRASVQLNYGYSAETNVGTAAAELGNLVIQSDNAYIPSSVKALMTVGGITSFTMGTLDMNNCDLAHLTLECAGESLGISVNKLFRQNLRGVFTLDGELGNDWGWEAFGQFGQTKINQYLLANPVISRIPLAADAVSVTSANVGASGLQLGSIACRSTLTSPTNGCKPLDVFGVGVASTQAINWIDNMAPGNRDYVDINVNEADFSASAQGTLPWKLPAGSVALATGAEWRHEIGRIKASPLGATTPPSYDSGNFVPFHGGFEVTEGFLELDAPVLKDDIVQTLDVNMAGRITGYSTSGMIETWKLGATSQINDDFRLRTVWSTDIRAPNVAELFNTATVNTGAQPDLHSPNCTAALNVFGYPSTTAGCPSNGVIPSIKAGNPNLVPEVGRTITAGVVLTPHWLDGLQLGFDWYNISIADSIVTVTGSPSNCAAAIAVQYCSQQQFTGAAYSNGKLALTAVLGGPVNAASERVSGVDIQGDYRFDFLAGSLALAVRTTYVDEHTIVNLGVTCDQIGTVGLNGCGGDSLPKFKGTLAATYAEGPFSVTVQSRFQGAFTLNNTWTSGVQVDNNHVDPNAYLDMRASYKWNDNLQFFGAIDNVQDIPPLLLPPIAANGASYQSQGFQGDNLGRVFRMGVRLSD